MNICHAEILNFRALKKVDVPLNNFSVLLGENDVGKTSFLFALERFFSNKKVTEKEDFFCEKTDTDISITLTFENLRATLLNCTSKKYYLIVRKWA